MAKGKSLGGSHPDATGDGGADGPLNYDNTGRGLRTQQGGALAEPGQQIDWSEHMTPDEFRQFDTAIQQNVNPAELIISRLAMMQALSPEIKARIPGYEQGMILDNNTREVYSVKSPPPWMEGKVPDLSRVEPVDYIRFVPVFKLPNEYMRWKHRNTEGKGWWWKTLDPHEKVDIRPNMTQGQELIQPAYRGTFKGGWKHKEGSGAQTKAPPTTENLNFLGIVIDENGGIRSPLIIATFAKTSAQAGSKFVSALQLHKPYKLPYFGKVYYLWSHYEHLGENDFYTLDVAQGYPTPNNPELISIALDLVRYLSDVEHGKERQEAMISNAVDFDDSEYEESVSQRAAGDGGYVPTAEQAAAYTQPAGQAAGAAGQTAPLAGTPDF